MFKNKGLSPIISNKGVYTIMTQSEKQYENYEHLVEILGAKWVLEDLIRAMSVDEQRENFEYIARMQDIKLPHPDEEN